MEELALRRRLLELEAKVSGLESDASRYRALIKARHDLIVELDEQGKISAVSPALLEITGYSASDCIGRSTYEFTTKDYAALLHGQTPTLFDWAARRHPFELPLVCKNGAEIWLEGNIYAYTTDGGKSGLFCLYRDVTESKVLERETNRLGEGAALALALSGAETFEFDIDDGMVWQSAGFDTLLGFAGQVDWKNPASWLDFVHTEDQAVLRAMALAPFDEAQRSAPVLLRLPSADGRTRFFECRAHLDFRENGELRRIVGSIRNVTETQELRTSLQLALKIGRIGTFEWDKRLQVGHFSADLADALGLPNADNSITWDEFTQKIPAQDLERIIARDANSLGSKTSLCEPLRYAYQRQDGQTIWLETMGVFGFDTNGVAVRRTGVARNVTEEHLALNTERTLIEKLRLALTAGQLETFEWNLETGRTETSEGLKVLHGLPKNGSFSDFDSFLQTLHPDDQPTMRERFSRGQALAGVLPPIVYRCHRGGEWRSLESAAAYVHDQRGVLERVVGVVRDVTERASKERELLDSKQRLELALRIGEVGIADWSRERGWFNVNARYREAMGYQVDENPGRFEDFVQRVHPEDRDQVLANTQAAYDSGIAQMQHFRYRRPDGRLAHLESASAYVRNDRNELQSVLVVVRDQTESRAIEQSLATTVERLSVAMHIGKVECFERNFRDDHYQVTDGFLELFGLPRGFSTQMLHARIHPDDRHLMPQAAGATHAATNGPVRLRVGEADRVRWLEATVAFYFDELGQPLRSAGAVRDVTEQVHAETQLRRQSRLFEALIENSPDGVLRIDRDARFVLVNPAVEALIGFPAAQMLGRTPEELPLSPGRAADFRQRIDRFFATGQSEEFELHFKNLPNAPWLLVRYVAERGADGNLKYMLGFMRDVSQLKKAEQDALASARQLGQVLETAEEGIVVTDINNAIVFNNPKFEHIFGYGPNELIGKNESEFQLDAAEAQWQQRLQERKEGLSESYTHHFRRKDGAQVLCWVNAKPLLDERGQYAGTLAMLTDVTDLERSERELRQSIEWLEFSMESAQIAGMDVDVESGFSRSTVLFREWFGIPEDGVGSPLLNWIEHVHDEDRPRIHAQVQAILERGTSARADFRIIDSAGELRWLYAVIVTVRDVHGEVARVVFTVVDITPRRLLEAEREMLQNQVARTQREESLGTLASGLAHDLNNLLTTAFGHIDLARMVTENFDAQNSLDLVGDSLTEMTKLSQQLLAYSGKSPINSKSLDLNAVLEKIRAIMAVSVGKKAHFVVSLCSERLPVHGEESQLQQVTLNLLLNATEALFERGGEIEISTAKLAREQISASVRARLMPGAANYAVLTVRDSGVGMDTEVLARLFEPFYSTKGQGRGLGLSVVAGIIRAHQGAIEVESRPKFGSQLRVYLPIDTTSTMPVRSNADLSTSLSTTPVKLVLVVDDEPTLRNLICRTLNTQGFETLSAANGDEALMLLEQRKEIGLVLLDLTMPTRDGLEVYAEILEHYPKLRVVLMSGYNEQSMASRLGPDAPVPAFLHKPFRANELLSIINKALAND